MPRPSKAFTRHYAMSSEYSMCDAVTSGKFHSSWNFNLLTFKWEVVMFFCLWTWLEC